MSGDKCQACERCERCETCRFWIDMRSPKCPDDPDEGRCRRYPPQQDIVHTIICAALDVMDGGGRLEKHGGGFDRPGEGWEPKTQSDDWCGEWQARPAGGAA